MARSSDQHQKRHGHFDKWIDGNWDHKASQIQSGHPVIPGSTISEQGTLRFFAPKGGEDNVDFTGSDWSIRMNCSLIESANHLCMLFTTCKCTADFSEQSLNDVKQETFAKVKVVSIPDTDLGIPSQNKSEVLAGVNLMLRDKEESDHARSLTLSNPAAAGGTFVLSSADCTNGLNILRHNILRIYHDA